MQDSMSEQQPQGINPLSPAEQTGTESRREWSESEWFKTWLALARKGGNHPAPGGSRDDNG